MTITADDIIDRDEKLDKFEKYGITDAYLIGVKLKGELEASDNNGPIWKIQQDARKDAHKLKGDYPSEKVDHTGGIVVNIEATPIEKKKPEKED